MVKNLLQKYEEFCWERLILTCEIFNSLNQPLNIQ